MRAIFTMFAEDVGLLPEGLFTDALDKYWVPHPNPSPRGLRLWQAMNDGKAFGFLPQVAALQRRPVQGRQSLPLTKDQLQLLREAAGCDWSEVEPSIFGTLLERALDPVERHRLGAHYTPRAYVERLVRPTVEEPLREEWDLVRAEVRSLVEKDKIKAARKALLTFQTRLAGIKVLDPACGTGNFLYVTLDLMKRLEAEVLSMLSDVEGGDRGKKAGLRSEREGWVISCVRIFHAMLRWCTYRGKPFDRECSLIVRHSIERIIGNARITVHPVMDFALELHHDFRLVEFLGHLHPLQRLGVVELRAVFRQCMDVMEQRVVVNDFERLSRLNSEHVRMILAALLVKNDGFVGTSYFFVNPSFT